MKELNNAYADIIRSRYEENVISGKNFVDYMNSSTAVFAGQPVKCAYMPKLLSPKAWGALSDAAATLCSILDKVITSYIQDPTYRKLFPFSPQLEEMILTDAGYARLLPIARLDLFLDEDDFTFRFCEFNADGASAMNEDRELLVALADCDAMAKFKEQHDVTTFEFFDSWVREFLEIYESYSKKMPSPRVIISDFMDRATPNEFKIFKEAFLRAGIDTDICDIRDLSYVNGNLQTPDGKPVHAIYRRAVTRDIMERFDDVKPFIQAVKDNAVCLVGHFRTQVIHHKSLFMILRMPETLSFLTDGEAKFVLETIPETLPLKPGLFDLDEVLKNKNDWIIKPEDYYGSKGVYTGVDLDEAAWAKAIADATDTGYLLQRFVPPFKTENIDFNNNLRPDIKSYNNITGMFVYNGKLQGIYTRIGLEGTITPTSGLTIASMIATPKKTAP